MRIPLSEFMSTPTELHAFAEGISETLCPWPPRYQLTGKLLDDLHGEHHYYTLGRSAGVPVLLLFVYIIKRLFFGG